MQPERDGADPPTAGEPSAAETSRPLWLAVLFALGIVTLILVTFTLLFSVATGTTPPWWPR